MSWVGDEVEEMKWVEMRWTEMRWAFTVLTVKTNAINTFYF
jgi:hypothetical protein